MICSNVDSFVDNFISRYPFLSPYRDKIGEFMLNENTRYVDSSRFNVFLENLLSSSHATFSLFVYGTLLPGNPQFSIFERSGCSVKVFPSKVFGELYSVHDRFPAFVAGEDLVRGNLLIISGSYYSLFSLFSRLNSYEGFYGDNPLYTLKPISVMLEDSSTVQSFYYNYEFPTNQLNKISCGDWTLYSNK